MVHYELRPEISVCLRVDRKRFISKISDSGSGRVDERKGEPFYMQQYKDQFSLQANF